MAFTTQISAAGIRQKCRKGWLEIAWQDVAECGYDSFDYIIKSQDGQEIHINWVLFKNWREMETFIQSNLQSKQKASSRRQSRQNDALQAT